MNLNFPFKNQKKIMDKSGLTMIELLVVVAILGVLMIVLIFSFLRQLEKSRDATRKSDLEKIKVSFEEYYNDNGCYPDEDILDICYGDQLQPYLGVIPCDPVTEQPYEYVPLAGDQCGGYRLLADLENDTDPVIASLGCDPDCGFTPGYNYGVSVGAQVLSDSGPNPEGASPSPSSSSTPSTPSPSPLPSGPIYVYACDRNGTCNQYAEGHPFLVGCPITWETPALCAAADCVTNVELRCN